MFYSKKYNIYIINTDNIIFKSLQETNKFITDKYKSLTINKKDFTNIFWYFFINNIFIEYQNHLYKNKIFYISGEIFNNLHLDYKLLMKHIKSIPIQFYIDFNNTIQIAIKNSTGELDEFLAPYTVKNTKYNIKNMKRDFFETGMKKMYNEIEKYKYILYA